MRQAQMPRPQARSKAGIRNFIQPCEGPHGAGHKDKGAGGSNAGQPDRQTRQVQGDQLYKEKCIGFGSVIHGNGSEDTVVTRREPCYTKELKFPQ